MRHEFGDADAIPLERSCLVRIVGQQTDCPESELVEHFRSSRVDTLVRGKAQLLVGVRSIEAGVLRMISPELVYEPCPPLLLRQVKKHPTPGPRDLCDRSAQLVAAVVA